MRWLVILLLLASAWRLDAAVAVVNNALGIEQISVDRVRDMLLGRVTTWESGQSVMIVLCTDDGGEAAALEISGRSIGLLQRGWKRLVFSGTGAMPLVVTTRQSVIDVVARHPGAIAVLMQADPAAGCQVIPISGKTTATLPK